MEIGSLVECVNNSGCIDIATPELNTPYTVRGINRGTDFYGNVGIGIYLEEIKNSMCPWTNREWLYKIERFKEIQPPMEISIESLLQEPQMA